MDKISTFYREKKSNWLEFEFHMMQRGLPWLYHFTDAKNVPLIVSADGLYCWQLLYEKEINPPRPGGNDWSHQADKLKGIDQYVHLAFVADHPMMFDAKRSGRIGQCIVFKIAKEVVYLEGTLFSPDNANKSGVCFGGELDDFKRIDFELIYGPKDFLNPNYQKALKSEVMVQHFIHKRFIMNFEEISAEFGQLPDVSSPDGQSDFLF